MIKNFKNILYKKKKEVAVWGWWQGKNLGDNWIRQVMAKGFKGAHFIDTNVPVKDFRKYGFVICGGGGLFIREVPEVWKKKPSVSFGAIGLGAEFKHKNKDAFNLSKQAKFFFVRDQYSVESMHLSKKNKSYDMTFFDPLPVLKKTNPDNALFVWRDPAKLLNYRDFNDYIGETIGEERWLQTLENNFKKINRDNFFSNDNYINDLTREAGVVISARYHGIVAAIQRGVPCIGIDICPKIRSLLKEAGLEDFCLKLIEVDRLEEKIKECLENSEGIRQKQMEFTSVANDTLMHDVNLAEKKIKETVS